MKKRVHFIDCGGNIGQSVEYALDNYENVIIDTFEAYDLNCNEIIKKYGSHDSVYIHNNAVWVNEEKMKFYLQDWGARTGSSLFHGKHSTGEKYNEVQCVNICEWIKNNVSGDDYVILKLDIEGAEYTVIDALIEKGIDKHIDEWFIEWHMPGKLPNLDAAYMNEVKDKFIEKKYKWTDWSFHV